MSCLVRFTNIYHQTSQLEALSYIMFECVQFKFVALRCKGIIIRDQLVALDY